MSSATAQLQSEFDSYTPVVLRGMNVRRTEEDRLQFHCLGKVSYEAVRSIQLELGRARAAGQCGDAVIVCEHPAVLTLGTRTKPDDLFRSRAEWEAEGIKVVDVDRGGGPAYHGPGQLMLYPVVSLTERRMGVKDFVHRSLAAIADALRGAFDIPAEPILDPAGVWVIRRDFDGALVEHGRKIACVGLRIRGGVTDYGFCVNLKNSLTPYEFFAPCGLPRAQVTTVRQQLGGGSELDVEKFFLPRLMEEMRSAYADGRPVTSGKPVHMSRASHRVRLSPGLSGY